METRANYVAIGAFVMLVLVGVLGALYWLYRSAEPGASTNVRIIFDEPVTGLSTGGSVLFNGIRVGEVAQLNFAATGGDDVIAITRVSQKAPIKTDTVAKLGFQGLTGVAYISLTGGSESAPSLFESTAEGEIPTIRAETSAFTNVLDSAESVLQRVNTTLNEVNTFLGDNRGNLDQVVANVTELTGTLNQAAPQVSGLITDMASAGRAVASVAPQVTSAVDRANALLGAIDAGQLTSIVENVDEFTGSLPQIGAQAQVIVGNVNGLVTRLEDTAGTLGEAVTAVRDVVNGIDRDAVGTIVANVRTATDVIASRANQIGSIVDDAAAISTDLRGVADTVASRREAIGEALDGVGTLLADARQAVSSAAPAIERLSEALGAVTPQRVESIVANVDRIMADLSGQLPLLNSFITSATQAASSIATLTDRVMARADIIDGAMVDSAELIKNLREASTGAPQIVANVNQRIDQLGEVIGAVDPQAVGEIVGNANRFVGTLAAQDERITSLLTGADSTIRRVDAIASSLAIRMPQIGDIVDRVEETMTSVQVFAQALPEFAGTLRPAIANVSEVVAAIDPQAIEGLVTNAGSFVEGLAEQRGPIAELLSDAGSAMRSVDTLSSSLAESTPQIRSIIEQVDSAMAPVSAFANELPNLAASLRPGLENASAVLESIDPAAVSSIVDNAAEFSAMIAAQNEHIASILTTTDATVKRVEAIASSLAVRMPQIGDIVDQVEATARSAQTFATTLPEFAETLRPGIQNVSDVMTAVDPTAIEGIVTDARSFADTMAAQREPLGELIANAGNAARSVDTLASSLAQSTPQIRSIIDQVDSAMAPVTAFANELPNLAAALRPGVENASDVLAAIDPAAVSAIVDNAASFSATLAAQNEHIASILTTTDATVARVEAIASALSIRMPQIGDIMDRVEASARSAETFAAALPAFAETLKPGIENVSGVMQVIDPAAIEGIVANANSFVEGLAAQREPLASLIANASTTAQRASDLASSINARMPDIEGIVANVRQATDRLPDLVAAVEPGVRNAGTVLQSIDADEIGRIQRDVAAFTGALASQSSQIEALLQSASGAAVRIEAVASAIAQRMPQLGDILDGTEGTVSAARRFADALPGFADSLKPGIDNVSEVLQAVDPAAVSALVDDAGRFADMLSGESETIRQILADTRTAAADATRVIAAVSEKTPQITGAIDGAGRAVTSVETAAARLPELVNRLEPGIDNITNVLSAVDPEAIRGVVSNVQALAQAAGAQAPRIESIVNAVDRASNDAAQITSRFAGELDQVSAIIADAQVALTNAREFSASLPALLDDLRPGLVNASEALGAIDPNAVAEIVDNARSLSQTLRNSEGEIDSILSAAGSAAQQIQTISAAVSGRIDQISGVIDNVASFAGNLSAAGPKIEGIITRADGALDAVRNTVSAINAEAINQIVTDVRQVAQAVGSRAGEIGAAIDNATQAAKGLSEGLGTLGGSDGTLKEILDQAKRIGSNLEGASERVRVVVQRINGLLEGPVQGMVGNVSTAANDVAEVAAAFASRAGQIASGLARFSTGGLDDLRAVLNQGRSTLSAIESAVSSFDRDPSRVIFGGSDGPRYKPQRR